MKRLILAASTFAVLNAQAYQPVSQPDLGDMAASADLVFRGTVVEVDYRDSEATGNQPSLPHTFVTFSVQEVLAGQADGEMLTLRFLGGVNQNGQVMYVDGVPTFDLGDEDVVFVSGNGEAECPLVECSGGRFRLVEGRVYNEFGQTVLEDERGALTFGKAAELAAARTFTIGKEQFTRNIKPEFSMDEGGALEIQQPAAGYHLDTGSFLGLLKTRVRSASESGISAEKRLARSADVRLPFSIPAPQPVALPEPAAGAEASAMAVDPEVEAMNENGGNPVLK